MMLPVALVSAQEKSDAFKARFAATRSSTMNLHFTRSDTIDLVPYLNTRTSIYSLSVDATIVQPRESSFTRIVLEDNEGKDWLVLECDHFRYDRDTVRLREFCQETAMLFGVTPSRLKCYVAADAGLTINAIHATDQRPERELEKDASKQEKQHTAMRREQVQTVVDSINAYNRRHAKLWRADVTDWAMSEHDLSGDCGKSDSYFTNFKYYTEGIYEIGERRESPTRTFSQYADAFDWRFRHGKDTTYWVTPVRDQGQYGHCRAFAALGVIEAVTNLYFNDSLGLDLSEQDVIWFSEIAHSNVGNPMNYLCSTGVIDEYTLPYNPGSSTNMSSHPYGQELVQADGGVINLGINTFTTKEDYWNRVKSHIIRNGPGYWGFAHHTEDFAAYENDAFTNHYMTLVGWGTCTPDIYYTYVGADTIVGTVATTHDAIIGETFWIFKDSFGHRKDNITQHGGYRYIIFNDFSKVTEASFLSTPITRQGHDESEIVLEDLDYDGYFNWGIGSRPDGRLPVWAEESEDYDDSNASIGAMDAGGNSQNVEDNYRYVMSDEVDTGSWFQRADIEIAANKSLTLHGTVVFHPGTTIYFMQGSTLTVDGATIVDPRFSLFNANNATVIIKNGGKIVFTSKTGIFTHPLGLNLQIIDGRILYEEVPS